ncbi:type IV pilin-like G/H family protein [Phormidium sp. CLA17]|uniref:type IV pilin-like G/H family protein n=1 Tax=Leptolyngbya sp. Cla-17 TaxID=2803751 RepID=UPI001492EA0F|nr:type IV pilin-like G/H family protein [Leptolyngbya sp. Cla-17]MBM0740993.1 type IV pilin-like G/H family protein [Leptolyngbya sp. Cla-17]
MVTQSQLLNLAKQGNPQAIAALMNLVLEPKGVTTSAELTDDCLLIVVQSEKPLNRAAIVNFIRSGIGSLGAKSIRTVKVCAQKAGEAPLWVEKLQLGNPTPGEPIPTLDLSSQGLKSHSLRAATSTSSWTQRIIQRVSSNALINRLFLKAGLTMPKLPSAIPLSMPMPPMMQQLLLQINPSNQWMVLGGMAAIAFASGGVVAAVTNVAISTPTSTARAVTKQSFAAAMVPAVTYPQHTTQSLTDLTIAVQQNEVKDYLTKMSQTQQAFYQTNGRFSSSLAALEQASIPKSDYYAYKLTVIDQTQARLTAVPKTEKLKSYVSAVLANSVNNSAAGMTTILCESAQPSTLAPAAPEILGGAIACEAGSTNVVK